MNFLREINRKIRRTKRKLVRSTLGLNRVDKRIKFWEKRLENAKKEHHPKLGKRAKAELYKWRKRQTKLHNRHIYLQFLLNRRQKRKVKWLKKHHDPGTFPEKWVKFDGHEVAGWIAEILQDARDKGYWNGYVFSGRRSPQYSKELCEAMCGAPSCPGRCAGMTSNHCGPPSFRGIKYEGAIDVSDSVGLRRYCETHGYPLKGGGMVLPYDAPHFSRNGN